VCRYYVGDERYKEEGIGVADDFSDADGTNCLDFWQAQTRARERWSERNIIKAGVKVAGPYTVADAIADYLDKLERDGKSRSDAEIKLRPHVLPKLGKVLVSELTADQINTWLTNLATTPQRRRTKQGGKQAYGPKPEGEDARRRRQATANRIFISFRAALNHAFREGKADSDSAWRRAKPFKGTVQARTRYLNTAEAARLLNACEPDLRDLVRAALETGARYSELRRLVVSDFNGDTSTLHIRRSKSGKPRHIVLTENGAAFFAQLITGRGGDEHILRRANGSPWREKAQHFAMTKACQRAKVNISFHELRHTWASLAVMNGMQLMVVAKNLGHRDTRMVEQHYGHLAPSFIADQIRQYAPQFGTIETSNVKALR
jgi:integrase